MISVLLTEEFERRYGDLPLAIKRKAERRVALFKTNPFNPMLRTEKLHPREREVWSLRIDENYWIFKFRAPTTNTPPPVVVVASGYFRGAEDHDTS